MNLYSHLRTRCFPIKPQFALRFPLTNLHHPTFIRQLHTSKAMSSPLKRKAESAASPKTKKPKIVVPEYHLTPSRRDEHGEIIWPAPIDQIERAREIIREWYG
jgi:hypothetical protein